LRLGYSAKCGIEKRPWVHGNYGGYWYTSSKEEGRRRYVEVRKAVNEDPVLGEDVPVLLKRGCTEFELRAGPSDEWEITPGQRHVEELVYRYVESGANYGATPKHLVTRIHKNWIEHAYAVGDSTYKYFTNGEPLSPPYVTYHEELDKKSSPVKKSSSTKGKKGQGKKKE
jgi:hypothetical protein